MNKKLQNILLITIIPVLGIGFAAGIIITRSQGKFGNLKPLQINSYLQDWATLQGNEYVLNCQIDRQLGYREEKGRVLSVKLLDETGRLPVLVPARIKQNFETGQKYRLHLLVRKDTLYVEDVEKI